MSDKLKVEIVRTLVAIGLSFLLLVVLITLVSDNPLNAIIQLFVGPISTIRGIGNVLEEWIPLVFTGLAVSLIFSSKQFNLASEGAFYIGGVLAMIFALTLVVPTFIFWPLLLITTGFTGAIIVGTPGYMKNKTGASEVVSSLMIISILMALGTYILKYYFKDPAAMALASLPYPKEYKLATVIPGTQVHTGIFLAIIAVIVIHILFNHTRTGFKMRIAGGNKNFARAVGINTGFMSLLAQIIGGCLAGIGGAVYQLGMYNYFVSAELGYGWDGVIVATLARDNPKYVPAAALFLAYLRAGSKIMARRTDVPPQVIAIVQGVIILLIVAKKLLAKYEYNLLLKKVDSDKKGARE